MRIGINGVGVAGPALAWWLKRYGYEPVLFERAPQLRCGGYIIDFWGVGYNIAERMGILPELRNRGYLIDSLRLVDIQGRKVASLDTKALRAAAGGRFLSIARSDVSAVLFRACEGVETRFGTHITGIEEHADGVKARLSDGSRETFDLVIGADGLHSEIRALAFGPEEKFESRLGLCVSAFTLKGYRIRDELAYISCAVAQRQVARVSLRDDETLFLFTFQSGLLEKGGREREENPKELLRSIFADMGWEVPMILARLEEVDDFYFDRVSQIRMEAWARGRVALVGDAAACISLLGGEGTGLAIAEAYVLAGELSRAGGDFRTAFQNYQRGLQPFLEEKQKSARGFQFFFAPKNRWELFLRKFIIQASSIPILSRYLIGRSIQDDVQLPDYK